MAEQALILIADISGFTEFTHTTEIDHASHIISELLELIVASNETDFTLAEIEGDAVLLYRKGDPLTRAQIAAQCLRMFSNFHQRLMVIERDTVCQCGACQTASDLTLKFVVHFGYIKEIKVAQFVKATGVDMIIAHRLLKNDVGSREYMLLTRQCCDALGASSKDALAWNSGSYTYQTIGEIVFEVATLGDYRQAIPSPPPPPRFVVQKGDDELHLVIDAPLRAVYQTLINVDKRPGWLDGVDAIDREMTSERINMRHNCVFHGMQMINTAVFSEYSERHARYSENVELPAANIRLLAHYEMTALDESRTHFAFNVKWLGAEPPADNKKGMMAGQAANFELFKRLCETDPA